MSKQDFRDHGISRQAVAAAELLKAIVPDGDDEGLTHDLVEGETDLFEAVEMALLEISECEIMKHGCDQMVKTLQDRSARGKARADKLRGLIDQAFQLANVKAHKFATATITTKKVPPKLIVTDESLIPSKYFSPQPPKLDLKALKEAAQSGPVDGALMSNGGTTIQIRRA